MRSHERTPTATDDLVPIAKEDPLSIGHDPNNPSINIIHSNWKNETVLRGEFVGRYDAAAGRRPDSPFARA